MDPTVGLDGRKISPSPPGFDPRAVQPVASRCIVYATPSVSEPPGPGVNYTGSREFLLELVTNLNESLYLSTCHTVHISVLILFMIMP